MKKLLITGIAVLLFFTGNAGKAEATNMVGLDPIYPIRPSSDLSTLQLNLNGSQLYSINKNFEKLSLVVNTFITTIEGWTDFTPSITVAGGGTTPTYTGKFVSRYRHVGTHTIELYIIWENTSGGTAGAGGGALFFSLPVTASANYTTNVTLNGSKIGDFNYINSSTWNDGSLLLYSSRPLAWFVFPGGFIQGDTQNNAARGIYALARYEID